MQVTQTLRKSANICKMQIGGTTELPSFPTTRRTVILIIYSAVCLKQQVSPRELHKLCSPGFWGSKTLIVQVKGGGVREAF